MLDSFAIFFQAVGGLLVLIAIIAVIRAGAGILFFLALATGGIALIYFGLKALVQEGGEEGAVGIVMILFGLFLAPTCLYVVFQAIKSGDLGD